MKPKYTERMWCVFETFVSVQQKIQPELILPESATESLAEDMKKEKDPRKVGLVINAEPYLCSAEGALH